MAVNNTLLRRICFQRPLVVVIAFALVTCFIFIIAQNIATSDNTTDDGVHSPELTRRNTQYESDSRQWRSDQGQASKDKKAKYSGGDDVNELVLRVEDLKRIKSSLIDELRSLQRDKIKILKDKAYLTAKNEKILAQINKSKLQLKQYELDILANKRQRSEQACRGLEPAPLVFNPMNSLDFRNYAYPVYKLVNSNLSHATSDDSAASYDLDFSLCKLTREFKFNVIKDNQEQSMEDQATSRNNDDILDEPIQTNKKFTINKDDACMTVILTRQSNSKAIAKTPRNALVISLSGQPIDLEKHGDVMGKSLIASSSFTRGTFRDRRDIVIPSVLQPAGSYDSIVGSIPVQSPIHRKYFASYFGVVDDQMVAEGNLGPENDLKPLDKILRTIHKSSIDDIFLFIYNCGPLTNPQCFEEREKMIEMSTFNIIIPNERYDIDQNTNDLLYLALSRGTVPVIVGRERVRLPFDEVIDWRRATLLLPTARLPELHFILKSLAPADLYALKYHGRRIFEQYLATSQQLLNSILSLISLERLNFPPPPIGEIKTDTHWPSSQLNLDTNCTLTICQEAKTDSMMNLLSTETYGPREAPFASPKFRRNFSLALINSHDLWNDPLLSPHHLYPSNPNDPIPTSEFKYLVSNQGYRPIANGQGGSGAEFSQSIGGDYPNEQFTIVILTYERINLLIRTLERLRGLAYLNKILVVWNGINQAPPASLVWPDVGVPIVLVKVDRNSLNNRFLPFDAIETDAIFSMDDDSPLRPDEIVFAFRVWRESRDRIVGFPGRYHAWDGLQQSWMYNSNHSCELSMVLTGGAFLHRYYLHVYSQLMPESIRSVVDKFMNCEDIAMNFLVAHLTRKPPIKVTSRWTFHCANCPTSLSEDDTHFMERHECLNIFASIYGYMPLLNTQHRSDSILFKTRLPKDRQKCFKFV